MLMGFGCTIVSLVFLTIAFMFLSKNQIREEYLSEKTETMDRIDSALDKEVHVLSVKMAKIYEEPSLINNLRNRLPDGANLKKFYWSAASFAEKRFSSDDQLLALYIYDKDNKIISNYRKDVQAYPRSIYNAEDDISINFQPVLDYISSDENEILISGYYNDRSGRDIVRLVLKLHDYSTDRTPYGYMVCDFDADVLTDVIDNYIYESNEIYWIQMPDDDVICTAGESSAGLALFDELKDRIREGYTVESGREDNAFYVYTSESDSCHIRSYLLTAQSLMLATRNTLFRTLVIAAILLGGLTFLIGAVLSQQLSKPIENMLDKVVHISNGELELRLETEGWNEELEVLGTEFNSMLDKLQDMITRQYETQILMERTEYQALQAQINPHFLYNTLNTMSGIAVAQDCPMLSDLCQSLSSIFRYSIDISDTLSDMRQEMQHVHNYLYIMDVRAGFQYTYEFDIPEEVYDDRIPRISLQPIVENAVNHGLRASQNKLKKLSISAKHIDGELLVRIEDNGIGMDADNVNEELLRNDIRKIEKGKSIGILNVNARIKKAFGDSYGLSIESAIGSGTRVTICIPIQKGVEVNNE